MKASSKKTIILELTELEAHHLKTMMVNEHEFEESSAVQETKFRIFHGLKEALEEPKEGNSHNESTHKKNSHS